MFYTFGYDKHFPIRQFYLAIPKIYAKISFQDNEGFVRVLVVMPYEVTFNFYDLELIIIHLRNNFRCPLLVKERKFFFKI